MPLHDPFAAARGADVGAVSDQLSAVRKDAISNAYFLIAES
jgi:hypothetical protein